MPNDGADRGSASRLIAGVADAGLPNPVGERLRATKRAAIEAALGKPDGWVTKVLAGDQGVLLEDIPALLNYLGLKPVDVSTVAIDPAIAKAYEAIVAKAVTQQSLLLGDAK